MYKERILKLSKSLYPTGRAFKMPVGLNMERVHKGLAISESQAYSDALAILYNILPDNANFSLDDAADWERRLGLITNTSVSLTDRKLAILRKINHPGTIPARQSWRYLEGQLQAAGFNVYVHENRFSDGSGGYTTKTPAEILGAEVVGIWEHDTAVEHGMVEHGNVNQNGSVYENVVANHIDESLDEFFDVGTNLRSTFFIGGDPLGTFADVDDQRKNEFRQLILKIKPTQTVAFLFVNYI